MSTPKRTQRIAAAIAICFTSLVIFGSLWFGAPDTKQDDSSKRAWAQAAEDDAWSQQNRHGDGWECWAEINSEMPEGYEVICDKFR